MGRLGLGRQTVGVLRWMMFRIGELGYVSGRGIGIENCGRVAEVVDMVHLI